MCQSSRSRRIRGTKGILEKFKKFALDSFSWGFCAHPILLRIPFVHSASALRAERTRRRAKAEGLRGRSLDCREVSHDRASAPVSRSDALQRRSAELSFPAGVMNDEEEATML